MIPDFNSEFFNTKKEAMTDTDDDDSNSSEKGELSLKSNSGPVIGFPNLSVHKWSIMDNYILELHNILHF